MFCGVILMSVCVSIPTGFADEGKTDRPESVRDRGSEQTENRLRDGDRERGGLRDGDRFQSMRDRMQQRRPDGQGMGGPFSGRPGAGEGQRGPAAIPMFRALDRNGDDSIDAGELDLAIASLRTLDRNNDGKLTMQELLFAGAGQMGMARPDMAQRPDMEPRPGTAGRRPEGDRPGMTPGQMPSVEQMFTQLDRNGDGSIDKDEAPGRLAENFGRADQNGDGKIDKKEMEDARQKMASMGQRDGRSQQSSDPAGGTRPRRPETEE